MQEAIGHLVLQALEHVIVVVVDEAEGPTSPPVDVAGAFLVDLRQELVDPYPRLGEARDLGPGDVHAADATGRLVEGQPP